MSLRLEAPAKINLWLNIFPPDQTGYHPLDTLFCAIDLADDLIMQSAAEGIHLEVSGIDCGPFERNLAYRAAVEFYHAIGTTPNVAIKLNKNIPTGAGLGGGSSDAAAVLQGLNTLHDAVVPSGDLLAMAARLGSDVPFFLCGSHMALARGRGELLQPVPPLPVAHILVIAPRIPIATAQAYAWLAEARAYTQPNDAGSTVPRDWSEVARRAHNDFERVIFDRMPELRLLRDALRDSGALMAMLSGSGSALFGVYATERASAAAAQTLGAKIANAVVIPAATLN